MCEPLLGEIKLFSGNFEPEGWMFCDGRLLPISEHPVLFELIGNSYGGDGLTTFGLPDLRGRVPMGQGAGSGLTNRKLGEEPGSEIGDIGGGGAVSDGGTRGVSNVQPSTVLSFIIAIRGLSPREERDVV